ncbi:MAG: UTRA domain-containing protein [Pseudomonadota bacterium]
MSRELKPSVNTPKREATVLRGIFKLAVRKGYLKPGEVPQVDFGKSAKKRRPAFTKAQMAKLLSVSEARILEAARDPKLRYQRYLPHQFIVIAVETGLRTKELFNLDWGHIENFVENIGTPIRIADVRSEPFSAIWWRVLSEVTSRYASQDEIDNLSLSPGAIVLCVTSVNEDMSGQPIEYGQTVFAAERTTLQFAPAA